MATLYELTQEFQELLEIAQDPEVDPQVVADTMDGLSGEIEDKAEGYVIVMKDLEAQIEKVNKEISRLSCWKNSMQNHVDGMKKRLLESMLALGKTKLPTEHFKLSVAKNGGLQPLKITGEVPADYCKLEPDNNKIRKALADGALDFAHLEERGVHLNVW